MPWCTRVIGQGLLQSVTAKCGHYKWILAPTARNTIAYLRRQNVALIEPGLNPVDDAI